MTPTHDGHVRTGAFAFPHSRPVTRSYLPLGRGRNELVMAVAEYTGGWAFWARLDPRPSDLRVD